jgi:hypothetical protein
MRNTIAKKLRAIINPAGNSVNKRVYRRAKKQYNRLPKHARQDYITGLANFYEQVVTKQHREPVAQEQSEGEVSVGESDS